MISAKPNHVTALAALTASLSLESSSLTPPPVNEQISTPISARAAADISSAHAPTLPPSLKVTESDLLSQGGVDLIGVYMPFGTSLSPEIPQSIKQPPPNLNTPLYGEFNFGNSSEKVGLALSENPSDGSCVVIVDKNRNGDLSDDPPVRLGGKSVSSPDGSLSYFPYKGKLEVQLTPESGSPTVTLGFSGVDRTTREKLGMPNSMDRFSDYAIVGTLSVDGTEYKFALEDPGVSGTFVKSDGSISPELALRIDTNLNGRFEEHAAEKYRPPYSFRIGDHSYQIDQLRISAHGEPIISFKVSEVPAPKTALAPVIAVGLPSPKFEAREVRATESGSSEDGKEVRFPDDFKDKLVLIVLETSWCGHCVNEIPFQKEAYVKFKERDFTIVSISIDVDRALFDKFLRDNKLPWTQIYDPGGWESKIYGKFAFNGVPGLALIDGSSGTIVALNGDLRGPKLAPLIESQLQKRSK